MSDITRKKIKYFGKDCYVYCDGKCYKAWGLPSRPRVKVGNKEYWVSDSEFDYAPDNPETYEGGDGKPMVNSGRDMNKWCARCCERSFIVNADKPLSKANLTDWNERQEIESVDSEETEYDFEKMSCSECVEVEGGREYLYSCRCRGCQHFRRDCRYIN